MVLLICIDPCNIQMSKSDSKYSVQIADDKNSWVKYANPLINLSFLTCETGRSVHMCVSGVYVYMCVCVCVCVCDEKSIWRSVLYISDTLWMYVYSGVHKNVPRYYTYT